MTQEAAVKNATEDSFVQLVVFKLANELYAVDIGQVNTIIRMQDITEVPRTPEFIEGVINLRGSIVPVIDLRKRFELEVAEETKASRIVIVETQKDLIGVIVDAVTETFILESSAFEPPPPVAVGDSNHIKQVAKRGENIIILLDIDKVLSDTDLAAVRNMNKNE